MIIHSSLILSIVVCSCDINTTKEFLRMNAVTVQKCNNMGKQEALEHVDEMEEEKCKCIN